MKAETKKGIEVGALIAVVGPLLGGFPFMCWLTTMHIMEDVSWGLITIDIATIIVFSYLIGFLPALLAGTYMGYQVSRNNIPSILHAALLTFLLIALFIVCVVVYDEFDFRNFKLAIFMFFPSILFASAVFWFVRHRILRTNNWKIMFGCIAIVVVLLGLALLSMAPIPRPHS